ncbi:hypothetical protein HN51_039906 [Arachis hypogaea]
MFWRRSLFTESKLLPFPLAEKAVEQKRKEGRDWRCGGRKGDLRWLTDAEKADQLIPANDPIKFANCYCELKYPVFATSRNLYLERTLKIPEELQQYTTDHIKQRGWFFLERNLTEVNASWVREFYCNYFKTFLDAVHLREKQILVTEEAIEDILRL